MPAFSDLGIRPLLDEPPGLCLLLSEAEIEEDTVALDSTLRGRVNGVSREFEPEQFDPGIEQTGVETRRLSNRRKATVRADDEAASKFEVLVALAVRRPHADDAAALVNEVRNGRRRAEFEVLELVGAVDEQAEQRRLLHQQAVVVRFRQFREVHHLVGTAERRHFRSLHFVVVEGQNVVQHAHLREQPDREGLEEVAAKLAVQVRVTF